MTLFATSFAIAAAAAEFVFEFEPDPLDVAVDGAKFGFDVAISVFVLLNAAAWKTVGATTTTAGIPARTSAQPSTRASHAQAGGTWERA